MKKGKSLFLSIIFFATFVLYSIPVFADWITVGTLSQTLAVPNFDRCNYRLKYNTNDPITTHRYYYPEEGVGEGNPKGTYGGFGFHSATKDLATFAYNGTLVNGSGGYDEYVSLAIDPGIEILKTSIFLNISDGQSWGFAFYVFYAQKGVAPLFGSFPIKIYELEKSQFELQRECSSKNPRRFQKKINRF